MFIHKQILKAFIKNATNFMNIYDTLDAPISILMVVTFSPPPPEDDRRGAAVPPEDFRSTLPAFFQSEFPEFFRSAVDVFATPPFFSLLAPALVSNLKWKFVLFSDKNICEMINPPCMAYHF